MVVTYNVVQSDTGLTESELNTLGASNWNLLNVVEGGVGYHYIFYNGGAAVTYSVIYVSDENVETEVQNEGNSDFVLLAHIRTGVGTQFIFGK